MTDFASTTLGIAMVYAGCVLLFQSGKKRAAHPAVHMPAPFLLWARRFGWLFLLGALVPLSAPQGVERGVAVWLGVAALAGMASLLISALSPRWHLATAVIVAGIAVAVLCHAAWGSGGGL